MSFEGASGKRYNYQALDLENQKTFPPTGGNYVFTRGVGKEVEIVCAGETDNWNISVFRTLWSKAAAQCRATKAYIHVNPDQKTRQIEGWDLIKKHRPQLNVDIFGEHALAFSACMMTEIEAEAQTTTNLAPHSDWCGISPLREKTNLAIAC